jgi:hypothetical protein
MADSTRSGPVPSNYRPVEVSERRPGPDSRLIREPKPARALMLVIHVKVSEGQAGFDGLEAFARERGLVAVATNVSRRSMVIWGTAARIGQAFFAPLGVYESPAGTYCGWEGRLHLPAGLAEAVEAVSDLIEREIEDLEHWLAGVSTPGGIGAGGSGIGQGTEAGNGDRAVKVFDLIVPEAGPAGAVNPAAFSLVQVFDMGWLMDPGYQRQLDNFAASPGAFKTVRIMKPFTNGIAIATATTSRPALPNETGASGTTMSGNVWPAGGAIDFTGTLNGLYQLTQRNLIPFVVLGFFPDGVYTGSSYDGASPGPGGPPAPIADTDWTTIQANWISLVEAFFTALFGDPRFDPTNIGQWWFEVWNEPDGYTTEFFEFGGFWAPDYGAGNLSYYQQLYQATCTAVAAAVTAKGHTIQLGGPTITGPNVVGSNSPIPGNTPTMMSDFIDFVLAPPPPTPTSPAPPPLKCDFLSFHAKGAWTSCLNGAQLDENGIPIPNSAPILQLAVDAADQTAHFAQAKGMTKITVINDEADMRVFFDVPFRPRMTEQFPAWLMALLIAYDSLASEYAPIQFMMGSDDAELPIVGWTQTTSVETVRGEGMEYEINSPTFAPAAFGQQRSIMTAASTGGLANMNSWGSEVCPIDLLKVPVYNFYELLRLLGDRHGTFLSGSSNYYPHNSDLFHIITVSSSYIGSVFCVYPPNPPGGPSTTPRTLTYSIVGIPWSKINWYQFQIDPTHSNGFNAAGGPAIETVPTACTPDPFPVTFLSLNGLTVAEIRQQQELQVAAQSVGQPITGGRFEAPALSIPAYTTTMFWITQFDKDTRPGTLSWIGPTPPTMDTTPSGMNVVLRWTPSTEPTFYTYEISRDEQTNILTNVPVPLRSALWIDTNATKGHTYWVRAVSASNIPGDWSAPIMV